MRLAGSFQFVLLLVLSSKATGLNIPLEVEQLPTIISHTSGPVIALPYDNDNITIQCEARGNPPPEYRWTKDDLDFIPPKPTTIKRAQLDTDGTFVLQNKSLGRFQGKYRCYASNKLGTAMTEAIELIVPIMPKFPKEKMEPIIIQEGEPFVLKCNPPEGFSPRKIHWMSIGLQHIEQDERVSTGTDGSLYFSHALQKDSRQDYCCFADFRRIIVQKTAMAVEVIPWTPEYESADDRVATLPVRTPSLLLPSGVQTERVLVKGAQLQLECIPGGYPTPKIEWMKMGEDLPTQAKLDNFGKLLTIAAIEESDGGTYSCLAKNPAGQAIHYFDVIVEEPPQWLNEPPESQLNVIGSDVHIKCSVSGSPPPDIVWRKNGHVFEDDPLNNKRVLDDTLILHNALPEDSGVYQCEASNRHGGVLANINIMVMNLAPLILTKDYQEYTVIRSQNMSMNCRVFGSPLPTISWAKDETPEAIEGERFIMLHDGSLQISSTEKEDSGEYVCVADNSEGKSSITAVLAVKEPTQIVNGPQDMQVISGTTAHLTCQAQYDESLKDSFQTVWIKDGEKIQLSLEEPSRYFLSDGMLQIMNVKLSDEGMYTCMARTHLDVDNVTALLTVLDVPDAPQNVLITKLNNPRNISLSWIPGSDHNSSVIEFIVEYEESQWEPGKWKELHKVPGNQATVELALHGHLNYQFRVYAVNAIGPGPPSEPTERYKTPPAAPDRNPENIKIHGHVPHQMDIGWEPLLPVEQNGPGLEYKVSYRKLDVDDTWSEHLVKRHSFVVSNTSTFIPYEIKIRSRNSHGWGPQPKIVTGYSGEDVVFRHCLRENVSVPTAAPRDIAVEVMNTTVLRVSWNPIPPATVRGHLRGYHVHWLRKRSFLYPDKILDEHQSLSFPGKRTHAIVPGLEPFSEYTLTVNVFNKKGNGPSSDPVTFNTPEGVPEQVPILTTSNARRDSVLLVWGPPLVANGILTGYHLQYHLINETTMEVLATRELNISGADTTHWQLKGLKEGSLYLFHLSACTRVGCGPPLAQESSTVTPARHICSVSFPRSIPGTTARPPSLAPSLLNISSYVSDTYAKISWTARVEQQDSQLYVAYMNNRDGNWRISEAVNTSQSFHVIGGLKPGTVYTVRLMAKALLDNASIFEDVIQTQVTGVAGHQRSSSTRGWFIGTMCAVALLTLVVLTVCFLGRNKGGKYAGTPPPGRQEMLAMDKVKEKEDRHPDEESQAMNDDTFCEYSDSDEKPLKGSSCSLNGDDAVSRDSLVDYADGGGEFSEDGSFIGEYSGHKGEGSVGEPNGFGPVIA
ncbi:neural cell adhesion molecule L1-like protein isoform X2 [Nerophis ophidion]|uniref:neural cell adhesion molecule L1-like protein isoform X2 n=1 Tax=Nerophis ophidion TaxID=159077 RepID=UPI002AE00A53|nr:neural cell adhesion molecule L1-like protein isoform X2 [Nerophis ophidion]